MNDKKEKKEKNEGKRCKFIVSADDEYDGLCGMHRSSLSAKHVIFFATSSSR